MDQNEETNLRLYFLFKILLRNTKFIFLSALIFLFAGIFTSLFLQNTYQSSALISLKVLPKDSTNSLQPTAGLLGGLINNSMDSNNFKHILISRDFFQDLSSDNLFVAELMATKNYDPTNKTTNFDEEFYNPKENKLLNSNFSLLSFHAKFLEEHLHFEQIEDILEISIVHSSPVIAKRWTELVLTKIDEYQKERDQKELLTSISFLEEEYTKSTYSEIRNSLTNVIGKKYEDLALINSSDYYSFEIIDSPYFPESIYSPNRPLIALASSFFGIFLSIFLVLIVAVLRPQNTKSEILKFIKT